MAGRKSYRQAWMSAISALSTGRGPFPLLTCAVYVNDREPYHWPDGYGSPDWRMTADHEPERAIATRKTVLDRLARDRMTLVGFHLPYPGVGKVETKDSAYRFVPTV